MTGNQHMPMNLKSLEVETDAKPLQQAGFAWAWSGTNVKIQYVPHFCSVARTTPTCLTLVVLKKSRSFVLFFYFWGCWFFLGI